MSRYIDADAIDIRAREGYSVDGVLYLPYRDVRKSLDSAPSIDIVRCTECKYEPICTHSVQHTTHELTSVTIGYKTVEWCSYGERESE